MAQVTLTGLVKHYANGTEVIKGIDLDIRDGEFIVFVGPSGCGKSTLLRMIAGLEDISGGELRIGGKLANHIPPAQRGLAMVFQSYALYPHMSVFDNMAFALQLANKPRAEVTSLVQRAAEVLQITHLLERKPKELSGGQRQRVAIGRAIVRTPEVFLFDEPLSNLDASLRVQMRVELSRLHQQLKTTMIYVTHDQVEAMTLGERIVVINGGKIEQVGSPLALYNEPANLFVAGFLGAPKMNFLAAQVVTADRGQVTILLPDASMLTLPHNGSAARPGDKVTLGVRAEHLVLADTGLSARVGHVEHLGDTVIVYAEVPGGTEMLALKLAVEPDLPRPGAAIRINLPAQHSHLFDAEGKAFGK